MPRFMSVRIGDRETADGEPLVLVEANLGEGVVGAPLSKYMRFHTRICRPSGLTAGGSRAGLRLRGRAHRLRLRRQEHPRSDALPVSNAGAAALASPHDGDGLRRSDPHHLLGPDRAGFRTRALSDPAEDHPGGKRIRRARRSSKSVIRRLYAPRDFDISPYFEVVKPTLQNGFDYRKMQWADQTVLDIEDRGRIAVAGRRRN